MISSVFEYILSSKVQSVYITIYYIFEVHKLFSNKVLPFGIWCIKKKIFYIKIFLNIQLISSCAGSTQQTYFLWNQKFVIPILTFAN